MVAGLRYWVRMSVVPTSAGKASRVFLSLDEATRCSMRVECLDGVCRGAEPICREPLRVSLRNTIFSFSFLLRGTGEPYESQQHPLPKSRFTAQNDDGNDVMIAAFGQSG